MLLSVNNICNPIISDFPTLFLSCLSRFCRLLCATWWLSSLTPASVSQGTCTSSRRRTQRILSSTASSPYPGEWLTAVSHSVFQGVFWVSSCSEALSAVCVCKCAHVCVCMRPCQFCKAPKKPRVQCGAQWGHALPSEWHQLSLKLAKFNNQSSQGAEPHGGQWWRRGQFDLRFYTSTLYCRCWGVATTIWLLAKLHSHRHESQEVALKLLECWLLLHDGVCMEFGLLSKCGCYTSRRTV